MGQFIRGILLSGVISLTGCALSERKAAEQVDYTPVIIQQSTDLLAADRELGRFQIVVDGFKGAMRLRGGVNTPAQKERAAKIVWTSKGVRSVDNELQVQPGARR